MSDNNELYEPDLISVTDDDGNELEIVRDNMPYGNAFGERGTLFGVHRADLHVTADGRGRGGTVVLGLQGVLRIGGANDLSGGLVVPLEAVVEDDGLGEGDLRAGPHGRGGRQVRQRAALGGGVRHEVPARTVVEGDLLRRVGRLVGVRLGTRADDVRGLEQRGRADGESELSVLVEAVVVGDRVGTWGRTSMPS